jgi:polysaccharide export outer membrane protein
MTFKNLLAAGWMILATVFAMSASAQEKAAEYRLGNGDSIRISVFQNPDLTLETRVSENGAITFPLVGSVAVGGLTIGGAEQVIAKALQDGGFINQPQVNVLLLKNLGNQVSVLGQAGHPGRFPLETFNTKLSEILAMAGGIGPGGSDIVVVTGTRNGKPFRKEVDVGGMFLSNNFENDLVMMGGDVIFIAKQPMFYVYGEVQHPGSFRVERSMSVRQALAQAGGFTARASERSINVYRRGADGKRTSVKLDDPVLADDVLYVGESLF